MVEMWNDDESGKAWCLLGWAEQGQVPT